MNLCSKYLFNVLNSRAVFITFFLGAWLILAVSTPLKIGAQPVSASRMTMKNLKSRYGLNDRQLNQLRPHIERHAGSLSKILNKFRDRSEIVFCPFWMDTDIWLDLQILRQEPVPSLLKSQRDALGAVFSMMEKEVLLILADEQVLMLSEELELDSYQAENIYKVLVSNIRKNQLLLDRPLPGPESLSRKLEAICKETEIELGKLLLPEQFNKYKKNKQKIQQEGFNLQGVAILSEPFDRLP